MTVMMEKGKEGGKSRGGNFSLLWLRRRFTECFRGMSKVTQGINRLALSSMKLSGLV